MPTFVPTIKRFADQTNPTSLRGLFEGIAARRSALASLARLRAEKYFCRRTRRRQKCFELYLRLRAQTLRGTVEIYSQFFRYTKEKHERRPAPCAQLRHIKPTDFILAGRSTTSFPTATRSSPRPGASRSLSPRQPENTFAPALDLRSYSRGISAADMHRCDLDAAALVRFTPRTAEDVFFQNRTNAPADEKSRRDVCR